MKKLLLTTALLLLCPFLQASEVDSFRKRFEALEDSRDFINNKFNNYFEQALDEANQYRKRCSTEELYDQLRKRFKNHVFDKFNKWLKDTQEIPTITTKVTESIYQDFDFFQSPIQGGFARIITDPTGRVINFNGVRVGTDKFEHMMGSGFKYFRSYYLKNNPLEQALEIGWDAETQILGAWMTGVMAYADMAANFQGMRFWNHVLQRGMDPLGENIGPYVECKNYEWVQTRPIDLAFYIGPELDEANNCSLFRTPKMLQEVLYRISEYEEQDEFGRSYQCPIQPQKMKAAQKKYGPKLSAWLINSKGHNHTKIELTKPE